MKRAWYEPWFRPKRVGWGLSPASWQGWVLTVVLTVAIIALAVVLSNHH